MANEKLTDFNYPKLLKQILEDNKHFGLIELQRFVEDLEYYIEESFKANKLLEIEEND